MKYTEQRLVSVLIPTYNHAHCLGRALESVLSQTYINWEIIIIDNHSEDNTEEVISQFEDPRINMLKIHNNGVIAASRNMGVNSAKGSLIAFLDSDDWWAPRKLEESINHINSGADIVYHDLYLTTKVNQKWFWRRAKTNKVHQPTYDDLIKRGNLLVNSSVVIKKSCFEKIGLLSEDKELVSWEDFEFWLRVAKNNYKFKRINKTLGYYWAGGGNTTTPLQTIKHLKEFKLRYFSENNSELPAWYLYAMGKSLYKIGNNKRAIIFLTHNVFNRVFTVITIKMIIVVILAYIKK